MLLGILIIRCGAGEEEGVHYCLCLSCIYNNDIHIVEEEYSFVTHTTLLLVEGGVVPLLAGGMGTSYNNMQQRVGSHHSTGRGS